MDRMESYAERATKEFVERGWQVTKTVQTEEGNGSTGSISFVITTQLHKEDETHGECDEYLTIRISYTNDLL